MASDGEISCTNDPNFAVIYSFLKVFGELYSLEVPTIAKLQELIENTQEVLDPLRELHLRLLRRALKSVQSNRWERCLIKFCHQQAHHQEAWEIERFSYKKASVQVKLKILKILLEYQFTCHPKFKTAVNAISCKDLRLDPIGRDKNGCVYWLQVDHDANLCLYKEDQDEETWQLIARNREELVKIINQLKSGEEVTASVACSANEDSSGADVPPNTEPNKSSDVEEENEEEFLSPESESEHESDEQKDQKDTDDLQKDNEKIIDENAAKEDDVDVEDTVEENVTKETGVVEEDKIGTEENSDNIKEVENKDEEKDIDTSETPETESQQENCNVDVNKCSKDNNSDIKPPENEKSIAFSGEDAVGEAIEEPVMIVTGEGNGADCESSYIIGEEICEPVIYFYGEGWGYENDTGNPEVEKEQTKENSDGDNPDEECNGEHNDISISSSKSRISKNVKLKSSPSVNKRSFKKQSNDSSDVNKSDSKKHCIRDLDKSNGSNSNDKTSDNSSKRDSSVNDKSVTDSDKVSNNSIKKGRGKVKKKNILRKLKKDESKDSLNSVADTDNCQNSKASIIEKRKSSVSSDQDDVNNTENEKEKSPAKEFHMDEALPPKKLRLESTPESDISESHSKETVDPLGDIECSGNDNIENKDLNSEAKNDSVSSRKKIKAVKGKLNVKKLMRNAKENAKSNDEADGDDKKCSKSLKRSLLNASLNDKNKSESQSESEEDLPITSGKRLKTKPKKIITSSRKKVEAKLLEKCSSESEEETLYSIAGKKSSKKMMKRKPKGRDREKDRDRKKDKEKERDKESDSETPVRQSRRIAQMKIREEAERRHLEEVTLRELKKIHTKKTKEEEEEWRASGSSSSSGGRRRARRPAWRAADSTGPDGDSDSDEPLFEHEEPDLEFGKSDHEFSPESDLEDGEPSEPLKRARTLQEDAEAGGACVVCGSGSQPEWILLCDGCDGGYHASCLKPVLLLVPEGDWFCPRCNHEKLISALEAELVRYDELLARVREERARRPPSEPRAPRPPERADEHTDSSEASSGWTSSSSSGAVYRLRARRQLPVSYRSQEYDRLISSAIKEEYVEPTTSAGNQGRGKDISTIIEAAEEEKMKAEREAIEQGKPVELKKSKKKQRRKPRKLNSLDVPSEDDDETDEDFKDTGLESTSEDISSSAERDDTDSRSSDSLPIRRTCRPEKKGKDRPKLAESSPEAKKKKKVFQDSSSESAGTMEWSKKKSSSKPKHARSKRDKRDKRDKSKRSRSKRSKRSRSRGPTQYDAAGNVVRARVTYGGLSDENDWSPKHRTRQRKIDYTEMPNTESEDEMHKSSGKHMGDSSESFKAESSDSSEWESERAKRRCALTDLIHKTAVVPLRKLPEDVTRAKTEELHAHLEAQAAAESQAAAAAPEPALEPPAAPRPARGRGSRGGRGARGPRGGRGGRAGQGPPADDALAKLVGVKIKELRPEGTSGPGRPNQAEREKKRQEREAKQAEKEARKLERLQKREEKERAKELKAKEREEKKLARLALQESKRLRREKEAPPGYMGPVGPVRPPGYGPPARLPDYPDQRFPATPRLQVRAELRGIASEERLPLHRDQPAMREGTLSVAGSPQPFKPITEEPSIITRMPHMINQQYRGPMMYPGGSVGYGARGPGGPSGPGGPGVMYQMHPGLAPGARPYAQYYPHLRPPPYPRHPSPRLPPPHPSPGPPPHGHPSPGPPPLGHPSPGPPPMGHPSPGPPGLGHPSPGPPGLAHPGSGPPGLAHPGSGAPGLGHPNSGPLAHMGHSTSRPPGHPGSGPPGPLGPGPPGHPGPPGMHAGPPSSPHGAPSHPGAPGLHGPPSSPHGPHLGPVNMHVGPSASPHGPPGMSPHHPQGMPPRPPGSSPHGGSQQRGPSPGSLPGPRVAPPPRGHPGPPGGHPRTPGPPGGHPGPPGPPGGHPGPPALQSPLRPGSPAARDVKIKAEVKTEPEYRSPPASPGQRPPSPEPPRHPKIKHTENKDRRPRYPLGPYAPQYGPYGPYAPPEQAPRPPPPPPAPPAPFAYLRAPFAGSPGPYAEARGSPEARVKEEGGVFGGLVSYFSSQREDDLDA